MLTYADVCYIYAVMDFGSCCTGVGQRKIMQLRNNTQVLAYVAYAILSCVEYGVGQWKIMQLRNNTQVLAYVAYAILACVAQVLSYSTELIC